MPHERKRHIIDSFRKIVRHSPLIGVLGHRQVGKTTLLMQEAKTYCSLDDPMILSEARISAPEFVASRAGQLVAIDECQLAPELFPALKEWVRTHKKPGQFLMSGSVRFTSRSAIRESLTGRIMNTELFPFGVAELLGLPLPSGLLNLAKSQNLRSLDSLCHVSGQDSKVRHKALSLYLEAGGLPGICFVREPRIRSKKTEEQLYTILDRDLRSVYETRLTFREILNFLQKIAISEGTPINHSEIRRTTGLSAPVQKQLLYALEAVFVIRIHRIDGARGNWTYFLEDQAEWSWLVENSELSRQAKETQGWVGLLYRNLRLQFQYRIGEQASLSSFQTRSGIYVPIVLTTPTGTLGILPINAENISHRDTLWAQSFLSHYSNSSILFLSKSTTQAKGISERIGLVPATWALFD